MQTSLGLFLFSAFLTTAASLQCETCIANSTNCTGELVNCTAGQDTCGVGLIEFTEADGAKVLTIVKSCLSSVFCKVYPFYMHFGNGTSAMGNISCCTGDDCASVSPQLPPEVNQTNGLKCPACFSLNGTCPEEEINCVGVEIFCFDMDQRLTSAGVHTNITAKGCSSNPYCEIDQHFKLNFTFTDLYLETEMSCSPAKWVGPPHVDPTPGEDGASQMGSLLALSGILLLKILF